MVNSIEIGEGEELIPALLKQMVYEDNVMKRLQAMDTLLSAIDEDIAKKLKTKEFKKELNVSYLDDVIFIRKLKLYSKMNENVETAIEYLGEDYVTHPEFIFDEKFEVKVNILNKKINNFTGNLLKEYSMGDSIEF